jgi:hypothetical protein
MSLLLRAVALNAERRLIQHGGNKSVKQEKKQMEIVRDLLGGAGKPPALELPYNGDLAADSTTTRHKGSLVKLMDFDDVDHGAFLTFAGLATAMENVFGILEEEHGTSGNYLPDDAAYGVQRRKITPIFPSSVIRAEYVQADRLSAANYDTGATGTAASTTLTITITTADYMIGGWVYFLTGANAGYLHYITNNDTTTATFATALNYNVVSGDTFLVISPPCERLIDFNATFTDIKSEIDDGSRANVIVGLDHYVTAKGIGLTKLDRNHHDGVKIANARFYHDFLIPNTITSHPIATS